MAAHRSSRSFFSLQTRLSSSSAVAPSITSFTERNHITFLHKAFPEGTTVETGPMGLVRKQSKAGTPQLITTPVAVHFTPWTSTAANDFETDGFEFFNDGVHFSESEAVNELAFLANADPHLQVGSLRKITGARHDGSEFERAFQEKAVELMRKQDPALSELILVPTQTMLRRATGPGSSAMYLPHMDFDYRLGILDFVAPLWIKRWGKYVLENETVRQLLTDSGTLKVGAEPDPVRCTVDDFSEYFEVAGIQSIWVSLNDAPCDNHMLALCSWASVDKENDLTGYKLFGLGGTGLHPNVNQRWYAPTSLQFGQGVRFDNLAAPHVAVTREAVTAVARLSVECRVLILREK